MEKGATIAVGGMNGVGEGDSTKCGFAVWVTLGKGGRLVGKASDEGIKISAGNANWEASGSRDDAAVVVAVCLKMIRKTM